MLLRHFKVMQELIIKIQPKENRYHHSSIPRSSKHKKTTTTKKDLRILTMEDSG